MISFNSIPVSLRVPGAYIEFDASRALSGLYQTNNRVLLIGQRLAAGAVAALTPTPIVTADQAISAFGRGSMLARMAKALKSADQYSEVIAIALDDPGAGTAATFTLTLGGPATAAGTIALMIAGQKVEVAVASGDSADTIATAIEAAVDAALDLPVTAGVASNVVTLTARHKGTCGSDIDVRHSHYDGESLPAGVTLAIAAAVAGAGDPDYTTLAAVMGDEDYRTIILGNVNDTILDDIEVELNDRWGPLRMLESFAYGATPGSQGTAAAFGAGRNSELVSIIGTGASPTPPWEWAASYGGTVGYYSAIDPARPFQTLRLPGVLAPLPASRFTRAERELLLKDGISTYSVGSGGAVAIERAITTYQLNTLGIEDLSWLDVNTPLTLAYFRQAVRARILLKFPRHKLASDNANFGPGQAIVTPRIIRAELIALFREMEEAGLVENLDQFKADLIVERDAGDPNRVNALIPPDIVNQFRVFAAQVQFRL